MWWPVPKRKRARFICFEGGDNAKRHGNTHDFSAGRRTFALGFHLPVSGPIIGMALLLRICGTSFAALHESLYGTSSP
jgi:hypothetical protein